MKAVIASDHEGYHLKQELIESLKNLKIEIDDLGTHDTEPVDYPDYAEAVALALRQGKAERGILLCGSGVGACFAVNKVPGVRAGLCHDIYSAHQGVEHDDMNVIVLGAGIIAIKLAEELVVSFLQARFDGQERHERRLRKVRQIAKRYCSEEMTLEH